MGWDFCENFIYGGAYFFTFSDQDQVDPCSNVTCSHPLQECKVTDDGKPVCKCPIIACTRDYRPVCGTDGQTYSNKCMMDLLTCEANKIVSVDYEGECKGVESCKYMYMLSPGTM